MTTVRTAHYNYLNSHQLGLLRSANNDLRSCKQFKEISGKTNIWKIVNRRLMIDLLYQ